VISFSCLKISVLSLLRFVATPERQVIFYRRAFYLRLVLAALRILLTRAHPFSFLSELLFPFSSRQLLYNSNVPASPAWFVFWNLSRGSRQAIPFPTHGLACRAFCHTYFVTPCWFTPSHSANLQNALVEQMISPHGILSSAVTPRHS